MRSLKRLLYAILLIGALVGAVVFVRYLSRDGSATCYDRVKNQREEGVDCGGPCPACQTGGQILINDKKIFPHNEIGKTSFFIELANPYDSFWVKNFDYRINVYDESEVQTASFSGNSSIPPFGKRQIALIAADIDPSLVSRVDLGVMDPQWVSVREYVSDNLSVHETDVSRVGERIAVRGVLKNNSTSRAIETIIVAIFRSSDGVTKGVSSTVVEGLSSFSEAPFEIFWRSDGNDIDLQRTEIFTERR